MDKYTQLKLEHLICKWHRISLDRLSDNMTYHSPTIRAFLVDLRVIAESNPEPSEDARDGRSADRVVGRDTLNEKGI